MTAPVTETLRRDAPAERLRADRLRFREAVAELEAAQKPGAGVPAYMRWVNRRLGRYSAAAAYRLGWTPNVVTALSAVISFAGLALIAVAPPSVWVGLLAATLLALGFALDSADGQLARLTGTGGPAGEWLDHVVDAVRGPALHLAVLVGLWRGLGPEQSLVSGTWPLVVALLFCLVTVGVFMSQVLAEQLSGRVHRDQGSTGAAKSFALLPMDTGVFCWVFVLWGFAEVFLATYVSLFVINALYAGASMHRKFTHLRSLAGRTS